MRRLSKILALLAILVAAFGIFYLNSTPANAARYQVWGYYPWWLQSEWQKTDLTLYDQLLFFEIPVDESGKLDRQSGWPEKWDDLRLAAKLHRVGLQPTLTQFDARSCETLFTDPGHVERLLVEAAALVDATHAPAIQLDFEYFEPISPAAVSGFRTFLRKLKSLLSTRNAKLTLFVLTEDGAGLYDQATLALADYLVVQGYDAHYKQSPQAGPVAEIYGPSVDAMQTALARILKLGVPRRKILMSVAYFGYEWPVADEKPGAATKGAGSEISYAPLPPDLVPAINTSAQERVRNYGMHRDGASGAPYYSFLGKDGWHQGWFEDEQSLEQKFEFIKNENLAGVAVFPVGYDGGQFQPLLRRLFR